MQKGTTLLEALTCLFLITLLAGLAVPAWQQLSARQQLDELRNSLQQDFAFARTQAVMKQLPVAIAPRHVDCWRCGWRVWVDPNENGLLDAGESEALSKPPASSQLKIESNRPLRKGAIYFGDGAARQPGGAFLAATITMCHGRLPGHYQLIVSRSGRVRASKNTNDCL